MNAFNDLSDSTIVDLWATANAVPASIQAASIVRTDARHQLRSRPALPTALNYWAPDLRQESCSIQERSHPSKSHAPDLDASLPLVDLEPRPSQDSSVRKEQVAIQPPEPVGSYADPLEPLRERDLQALDKLFQRDDMYTLEADLNQMLLHLLPAPCWEEDAFEFLRDFL
ncbi:MAG: hypothetical protein NW220_00675 [Leptolyngbyaceae cyanobacterium bins.349]|nr:hypothetical protein [Leptolyngbyaceae cyanobacterium bins.349]